MGNHQKTIVVAMSGGVDSSVTAALLKEQGYHVIGMMLRLWSEKGMEASNRCCTPDSMRLAKLVADKLDIPFYTIDSRQEFYSQVVQPFIRDYIAGLTPNPCLRCNRHIRWGVLFENALSIGADYISTGHYARIIQDSAGEYQLLRGVDPEKDQSYVLHVLGQEECSRTLFPLGSMNKSEVRQLALKYKLPVAVRKDSQDLCFLGGGDYRDFLLRNSSHEQFSSGPIYHKNGTLLGYHNGLAFYTIGQRKGLGINSPSPLYVIAKDHLSNTLIVGDKQDNLHTDFLVRSVNWISGKPPQLPLEVQIKVRYRSPLLNGLITSENENLVRIILSEPYYDITPGQAAVFYLGENCLGGGIIEHIIK